jgi:cell division FtsZ-interacting protein ZapD
MCEKCVELDGKIKRYRWLASMIADQLTLDRIEALIAQLETRKAALHSAQE